MSRYSLNRDRVAATRSLRERPACFRRVLELVTYSSMTDGISFIGSLLDLDMLGAYIVGESLI